MTFCSSQTRLAHDKSEIAKQKNLLLCQVVSEAPLTIISSLMTDALPVPLVWKCRWVP